MYLSMDPTYSYWCLNDEPYFQHSKSGIQKGKWKANGPYVSPKKTVSLQTVCTKLFLVGKKTCLFDFVALKLFTKKEHTESCEDSFGGSLLPPLRLHQRSSESGKRVQGGGSQRRQFLGEPSGEAAGCPFGC